MSEFNSFIDFDLSPEALLEVQKQPYVFRVRPPTKMGVAGS